MELIVARGGLLLFIAIIGITLLAIISINWNVISKLIFEETQKESIILDILSKVIIKIKIGLLKFLGASDNDIQNSECQYTIATKINQTYFFQNKLKCCWQLFSYYMLYCLILVFLAKPIDLESSLEMGRLIQFFVSQDTPTQAFNILVLVGINVITDLCSLTITFIHLSKVSRALSARKLDWAIIWLMADIVIASVLFFISQLVSNYLYPLALENPPLNYDMWSIDAALMPYAFIESANSGDVNFYPFTFPGQIFITGSVFIPTIVSTSLLTCIMLALTVVRIFRKIQNVYLGAHIDGANFSPIPIAGKQAKNLSRADMCLFHFTKFSLGVLVIVIGGISLEAIKLLFGWA